MKKKKQHKYIAQQWVKSNMFEYIYLQSLNLFIPTQTILDQE